MGTPGDGHCRAAPSPARWAPRTWRQFTLVRAVRLAQLASSAPEDGERQLHLPHGSNWSQSCPLCLSPRPRGSVPSAGNCSIARLPNPARPCNEFEPSSASSGEAVGFDHREPAARPPSQAAGNTRARTIVTKLPACSAARRQSLDQLINALFHLGAASMSISRAVGVATTSARRRSWDALLLVWHLRSAPSCEEAARRRTGDRPGIATS